MKRDWLHTIIIIVLLAVVVWLIDYNWRQTKLLIDKQTKIEEIEIQINSLWDNVQQLQDEYGKIVDKLYKPEGVNDATKEY